MNHSCTVQEVRPTLKSLANQVRSLPPLPDALVEVLEALRGGQTSLHRVIQLIERDQALTASTLRIANSAFYGAAGQVHRVSDSIRILGLRNIASVLVASTLQRHLKPDACAGFSFEQYWRHAMVSAIAARALAMQTEVDRDTAFLAGLMQSVGQLVLASFMPDLMGQAMAMALKQDIPLDVAEKMLLGMTHRSLSALLLEQWHFPADVVLAVAAEEVPEPDQTDVVAQLARAVHIANRLSRSIIANPDLEASDLPADLPEFCQVLGLATADLGTLLVQMRSVSQAPLS